jgi:methylglyoxal synthase
MINPGRAYPETECERNKTETMPREAGSQRERFRGWFEVQDEYDAATATSGRLAHLAEHFGPPSGGVVTDADVLSRDQPAAPRPSRRPALALTAEGPRRADLIAWAGAHRDRLAGLRLLAPAGVGGLLAEHTGLTTHPLRSGTMGPAATAGLAAAGEIDAMIAFTDPIELRPGDTTTRSLVRLAVFWDIPIASNRATADLVLANLTGPGGPPEPTAAAPGTEYEPARGAVRLWTVRATVDDVPGRLAILAASLARRAINILAVQVHLSPDGPVDELLVAASPILSAADLTAAVTEGGARSPRVASADAHALVDAPTRALTLASRVVRTPGDLPAVLASLFPGAELAWRAEPPAALDDDPTRLWLADPTGGGFLLTRPDVPFTPAECARAYAMLDVATMAHVGQRPAPPEGQLVLAVLSDGREVAIRSARVEDIEAIVALHSRCSLTSRLRRYLAGTSCPPTTTLTRLLSPEAGHTLVAEDPTGRIVAMANLMWTDDSPELALLVEDGWQGRRLGTVLARHLVDIAERSGAQTVTAVIHAGNTPMIRLMSGMVHRLHREYDAGRLTLIGTLHPVGHTHRLPRSMWRAQSSRGIDMPV